MKAGGNKVYDYTDTWLKSTRQAGTSVLRDRIRRAMKQLVLNISPAPAPTFVNFIVGQNRELWALLQAMASAKNSERFVYLWGVAGAGKSHLLGAFAAAANARQVISLNGDASVPELSQIRGDETVIFDDVDGLSSTGQPALFHAYNRIRSAAGRLIASGALPPRQLVLLPDLKSRLGWGLVLEVKPLSDEEKYAAVSHHATARGFALTPEVIRYILSHYQRDLPSLMNLLAALDLYSLRHKRAITLPLLKEVIEQEPTLEL